MSNAEAMRWSMDRYLDHPNRNRQVVGVWSELGTHPSTMADYFVATHTFTYFLHRDHRWTEPFGVQVDDADELMKELLSPEHYPPGIPNIGCVEMSDCIPLIEELGYASVCGMFPNASMTSSIPTDPSSFTPADPPKVLEIDPNGIYLAWNGPDGDNINFGFHFNYPAMRRDPMTGQVPVAWRFNPYIIDLFPTLFAWYTQQGPGTIDLTSSLNDGGDPKTPEGRAYWIETYTHYLEASNGAIQVANFMGQFPNEHFHAMMGHVPLKAVVNGYHGVGERDSKLLLRDNEARTLYTNQIGFRGPKPSSIGHRFTGNAVIDLRQTIENDAVAGEPYFVVGRLPSECGLNGFSIAHHLTKRLQAQTDRTIYLVRVSDLAATLKAHRDRGSDYDGLAAELWQRVRQDAASDESITAFIDGLSSDDPLARRASAAGLRATDDARASDALLAVMDDEDEATRRLATAALARRGDPRAVDAVVAQFGEPGGEFIASHLHRFGDNGMIAADDVLKHAEDDATRRDAAVALAGFGTKGQPHVDTLAAALASADDRQAKLALIDALARTGDPAAVAPLIALIERPEIDDPDHSVRSAAVRALAMAGRESPETLPMLERALMLRRAADVKGLDSHPLRRAALLALERLGPDATDLADAIRPITGREGGRLRDLATRALAAVEATE
jgi:HEAT repeat protein